MMDSSRDQTQSKWQVLKTFLKANWKILLSHHPGCPAFEQHTIPIKSSRFCIGCFIGYPSAIVTLICSLYSITHRLLPVLVAFWVGIGLLSTILFSFSKFTEKRIPKILQKLAMGIGAGFFLSALYVGLERFGKWQIFLFLVFIMLVLNPIVIMHYRTMSRICTGCPESIKTTEKKNGARPRASIGRCQYSRMQ